jgi:hypothetical protein
MIVKTILVSICASLSWADRNYHLCRAASFWTQITKGSKRAHLLFGGPAMAQPAYTGIAAADPNEVCVRDWLAAMDAFFRDLPPICGAASSPDSLHRRRLPLSRCGGRLRWNVLRPHAESLPGKGPIARLRHHRPRFNFLRASSPDRRTLRIRPRSTLERDRSWDRVRGGHGVTLSRAPWYADISAQAVKRKPVLPRRAI